MYCAHCRRILPEDVCPYCLRPTREPLPEDECFLTERASLWHNMLLDVLAQEGIPCRTVAASGAAVALQMGPMVEGYRFYVPLTYLERAQQLMEDLFAPADAVDEET